MDRIFDAGHDPRRPLGVLHLHSGLREAGGGGGMSMFRLHRALRGRGVESRILVHRKPPPEDHVDLLPRVDALGLERHLGRVLKRCGLNDLHRLGSFLLPRLQWFREADVLHIHCTHSEALSYLALPFLTARKPTVFSLCDMWPITGHCGFSYGCNRWRTGCGECPYPDEHPAIQRDTSAIEWHLKQWAMSRSEITFIAKCNWMHGLLRESFLKHHPSAMIPQSVDVTVFRPLDRTTARLELGVPAESRVLMTAAVNLDHWRKGADLLRLALARLPEHWKRRLVLLTMGKEGNGIGRFAGIRTRHLGFVSEERRRVLAYAASDLFVMTSRADMTANVITESLACGTPVAAFAVGGVPEAVRPGLTGTLAEPGDVEGLSLGIASLLADDALMGVMRRKCREVAVEEYALDLQVDRHLAVYRYLVGPAHSSEPAEAHPAATRAVPAA